MAIIKSNKNCDKIIYWVFFWYKVIKIIYNTYRQTMDSVRYSQQLIPGNAVQNQLPDLLVVERTTCLQPVQVYECVIEIGFFFSNYNNQRNVIH